MIVSNFAALSEVTKSLLENRKNRKIYKGQIKIRYKNIQSCSEKYNDISEKVYNKIGGSYREREKDTKSVSAKF